MSERKVVPIEFYNEVKAGKPHPIVSTVGELRKQLERLPDDISLSNWSSNAMCCVVANYGTTDEQFMLAEYDED